jgi:hypothetical protein
MKRLLLALTIVILSMVYTRPLAAQSGYTTVTATVADSNGTKYVNAPYTITFFDPGTSGKLPLLSGSVFQQNYNGYATDGNGNLSISLPDNSIIASTSGATGTQWMFSICTAVGAYTTQFCIPKTSITISGASQNISAALTAVAPILPVSVSISAGVSGNLPKYTGAVSLGDSGIPASTVPGLNFVSSLPVSCTPGVTQSVQLTGSPYAPYYCISSGVWVPMGGGSFGATVAGGTAQAQTVSITPPLTIAGLGAGVQVCWLPVANNTGSGPTLAGAGSSTFTAKAITKGINGGTALVANDITTSVVACAIYDGTQFELQNPQTNIVGAYQTNIYGAFLQDFSAATMEIPEAAGFTTNVNSTIGLDTTANITHLWTNNADSLAAATTSTTTTTTQPLFATAVAGVYNPRAIATGDLPTSGIPNVVYNNTTNTGTAAMTLNMAASTTANSFVVPAQAGLTSGTDGTIAYDTTNKNTHIRSNGADSLAVAESSAVAANTVLKALNATNSLLTASGIVDTGAAVNIASETLNPASGGTFTGTFASGTTGNGWVENPAVINDFCWVDGVKNTTIDACATFYGASQGRIIAPPNYAGAAESVFANNLVTEDVTATQHLIGNGSTAFFPFILWSSHEGAGTNNMTVNGTEVFATGGATQAITGTSVTMTNGSTAVTGVGTSFNTQLVAGEAIKLNADANSAWMNIASIGGATSLTLTNTYAGTGGTGAASYESPTIGFVVGQFAGAEVTGCCRAPWAFNSVTQVDNGQEGNVAYNTENDFNNNSGYDAKITNNLIDQLIGHDTVSGGTNKPLTAIQVRASNPPTNSWQEAMSLANFHTFGLNISSGDSGSIAIQLIPPDDTSANELTGRNHANTNTPWFIQNSGGAQFVTLGVGTAGVISGGISFTGLTSGTSSITGPAVAGTLTNAIVSSNALQAGVAGTAGGILAMGGSTSGIATLTAPAVAGTLSNAIISSNALQAGAAGGAGGVLGVGGSTSGVATFTAPAVAGTLTNPVISSNAFQVGAAGGAGGKLLLGGSTSGTATFTAPAVAGTLTNAVISSNALQAGAAGTAGGILAVGGSTSGVATFTAPAVAGTVTNPVVASNSLQVPDLVITNLLISNTAPTIAAGGCGGSAASITAPNGTGSFEVNTGTAPGSACTITMPAATTSWTCDANTVSATSTTNFIVKQTGAISTTSVVLTLFTDAAATQAYTGSDTLRVKCSAN